MNDDPPRFRATELLLLAIIPIAILITGLILYYPLDMNEGFYTRTFPVYDIFNIVTNMGEALTYVVLATLIYLGWSKRFGRRLLLLFFITAFATYFLKNLFQDPRPLLNPERAPDSYGFPSGHTTTSVSFYGYALLHNLRERPVIRNTTAAVCISLMVLVPVSRLILGVHDVGDVASGYVLSFAILLAYLFVYPGASRWMSGRSLVTQIAVSAAAALFATCLSLCILYAAHPEDMKTAVEEAGTAAGLLTGCAIAFPLEQHYIDYEPSRLSVPKRIASAVIGLLICFGVYAAGGFLFGLFLPDHLKPLPLYFVLAIALALCAPALLNRFLKP